MNLSISAAVLSIMLCVSHTTSAAQIADFVKSLAQLNANMAPPISEMLK